MHNSRKCNLGSQINQFYIPNHHLFDEYHIIEKCDHCLPWKQHFGNYGVALLIEFPSDLMILTIFGINYLLWLNFNYCLKLYFNIVYFRLFCYLTVSTVIDMLQKKYFENITLCGILYNYYLFIFTIQFFSMKQFSAIWVKDGITWNFIYCTGVSWFFCQYFPLFS